MEEEKQPEQMPPAPQPPAPQEEKPPFDLELLMYFIKIIRTVFVGLFWMLVNIFLGLYLGFAVPEESTPGRLIFFYAWLIFSLTLFIYYIWKMWRKKEKAP
ncbi:hypothetical protein [Chitinophaga sp. CB10]|uniref:hypothetical protein n=1 Tax=Chitinophaga sp. CB10 TaxID=1891659 RepID=UPI0025C545A1|nr:hypothetical protein [Chitinophaga sp. CB10]